MTATLKELFLQLSDDALDPIAKNLIRLWDDPEPTALQILKVLDYCVNGGLCSDREIMILDLLWRQRMEAEGQTMETQFEQAVWKKDLNG